MNLHDALAWETVRFLGVVVLAGAAGAIAAWAMREPRSK